MLYYLYTTFIGGLFMDNSELQAMASEEARRLYEKEFSCFNPYTREIDAEGIPFTQRETFYRMVEDELREKGEEIQRQGPYFKIARYQRK